MYEYTAQYGMNNGSPLPVVVTAESFSDAVSKFSAWRVRKAENPTADELISFEPISVVNDTLRMQYT